MNVPVTLRRLWIHLTSDRRRFGLFCAALGVGLLLWARLIVITNTPRTVVADESAQAMRTVSPSQSEQTDSNSNSSHLSKGKQRLRVVLSSDPHRDPFVISHEHFPRRVDPSNVGKDGGKSTSQRAEDSQQSEQARLSALADRLKLEAVMLAPGSGGLPLVVINGRTYRLNDEVPVPTAAGNNQTRFRLVEVRERSAVVEYEGRRFERMLATPGRR